MLDRASTFAEPEIVKLLKTRFVPVALDQAYQRRQKDTEGEFYRKIVSQRSRNDFNATTQGFYIATAAGDLMLFNNNRDPKKVLRLMKQKLQEFDEQYSSAKTAAIEIQKVDSRYNVAPPKGGLVLRVRAKVLDGYEPTTDRWRRIFQSAVSRDNLWITESEHQAIVRGEVPEKLLKRIARFHLVDNTRGEPPMWKENEIRKSVMTLNNEKIAGEFQLLNQREDRGFDAELKGEIEVKDGQVVRFDMVCLGEFWGDGRYTRGAPQGRFPLAITLTLADGTDLADRVPPQGSRGWIAGYLQ